MNYEIFQTYKGILIPQTDTTNNAGGKAYKLAPRAALAQYCITGTFNNTFYVNGYKQVKEIIQLCKELNTADTSQHHVDSDEFIAKCALYCRNKGNMKDTPALLVAYLAVKRSVWFAAAFEKIITNGRMLRNFVQIIRSGILGRKSFGSTIRRHIRFWLNSASDEKLIKASIGNKPSLADIIKMVHPKAPSDSRNNLYKYFLGKECNRLTLPQPLADYELFKIYRYKRDGIPIIPDVPFQLLTSLKLELEDWKYIALSMPYNATRINLNTFLRHKVLEDKQSVMTIAARLRDYEAIKRSKVYPYQLMTTFQNIDPKMPYEITEALQDALEIACSNVPEITGHLAIGIDISGSMSWPITGNRGSVTTKTKCVDVAALIGMALLRKNPIAIIVPFSNEVVRVNLNPRDTVMTNAKLLSSKVGGGTNISLVLSYLLYHKIPVNTVIIVSDNESWVESSLYPNEEQTKLMYLWNQIKLSNPNAKLICLDLTPNGTSQGKEGHQDIFNIGGFSDNVFDLLSTIVNGEANKDFFVNTIEKVVL